MSDHQRYVTDEFDGVLRTLDLPYGWVLQQPSRYRHLGGSTGSFVLAGSVSMGVAVWGYKLPSSDEWLSLVEHCRIYLDDLAASPVPNVAVSVWMERPCVGGISRFNRDRLDMVSESNMRPSDECDCSVVMRTRLGR